jgi:hypothetical protein
MDFTTEKHTDFRVEYTPSWDPGGRYAMTVHDESGMTVDGALRRLTETLAQARGKDRWLVMDDARLIRTDDVVSARVVPIPPEREQSRPVQPFGFTLGG